MKFTHIAPHCQGVWLVKGLEYCNNQKIGGMLQHWDSVLNAESPLDSKFSFKIGKLAVRKYAERIAKQHSEVDSAVRVIKNTDDSLCFKSKGCEDSAAIRALILKSWEFSLKILAKTNNDTFAIDTSEINKGFLPGASIKDSIQRLLLLKGSLEKISNSLKLAQDLFDILDSVKSPKYTFIDAYRNYDKINMALGGVTPPNARCAVIQAVKENLNSVVIKDTLAANMLVKYDQFLSLWLTKPDSIDRDEYSLAFLQSYLPSLRRMSFSDSGLKKAYNASKPLIGLIGSFASSDLKSKGSSFDTLTRWLATYSTRKRSQNLQSALQILRDDDSLFAKVIPDPAIREWFWMVTNGLEFDTTADIISMDIPRMLVKIENKYMAKAKEESRLTRFYPILDIGVFSAFMYRNDSGSLVQVASEKLGVGYAIWKSQVCPSEALIKDPWNESGECGHPLLDKIGFEVFGSGLLYNSTNMKTNKAFNEALFSGGLSVYFRLGLTARLAYGRGYGDGDWQHHVVQVAMDIPLADYLTELAKKK